LKYLKNKHKNTKKMRKSKFEVLFRGKRADIYEPIEGFYWSDGTWHYIRSNGVDYEVEAKSIGMFTGEFDKNGERIFGSIPVNGEMSKGGDTVSIEFSGDDTEESEVVFRDGGFIVEADFGDYENTTIGWAIEVAFVEIVKELQEAKEIVSDIVDGITKPSPGFLERLIDEKNEVDGRIGRLEVFFMKDKSKEIDPEQITLLNIQLQVMKTYSQCLHERLVWLQK
jgi:hypothetical protein